MQSSLERLESLEELVKSWDTFRSGGMPMCTEGIGRYALAVDGSIGVYRLVCTQCGVGSQWFESTASGVRMRPHLSAPPSRRSL